MEGGRGWGRQSGALGTPPPLGPPQLPVFPAPPPPPPVFSAYLAESLVQKTLRLLPSSDACTLMSSQHMGGGWEGSAHTARPQGARECTGHSPCFQRYVCGGCRMLQQTGRGVCRVHPQVREGLPLALGS